MGGWGTPLYMLLPSYSPYFILQDTEVWGGVVVGSGPLDSYSQVSGALASKYIPVCSRLTLLGLASLFPQLQPTLRTWEAEAGRMCAVGRGVLDVTAPTLGLLPLYRLRNNKTAAH